MCIISRFVLAVLISYVAVASPTSAATLEEHVRGLAGPTAIANARDSRLFITERTGKIKVSKGKGNLLATPFLDISSRVQTVSGEQGLLGLAFHPNYAANGFFYVYYTPRVAGSNATRSRISRFKRSSSNPDRADPASETVIMQLTQATAFHNGGDIHFGRDGFLYIASGDGGGVGNGQFTGTLMGKLLRIDVNVTPGTSNSTDCDTSGRRSYGIPKGNAFNNGRAGFGCDEIYAMGLRNPFRFSFDRANGNIWIGDVGQSSFEEVDFISAGSAGGINFGWSCYEGRQAFKLLDCNRTYRFPVLAFTHAGGNCAVIGGYVFRGPDSPSLSGKYIFTDFCNSSIRAVSGGASSPSISTIVPAEQVNRPSTFGEGPNGELYVASHTIGKIFRIR